MNGSKRVWVWVGCIAAVVIVIAVVWAVMRNPSGNSEAPALNVTHAPQGQLVSGFPPALAIGAPSVANSYSINYSPTTNQYSGEWDSTSTPESLYGQYRAYASQNGWTITGDLNSGGFYGVYAENGSSSFQAVIQRVGNESHVKVTYVAG